MVYYSVSINFIRIMLWEIEYFDPVKIDEVNAGSIKAYMVDRGAMALVTKTHYPTRYRNLRDVPQPR